LKKILFIVNPLAGVNRKKDLKKDLMQYLDSTLFRFEIVYTEYAGHGEILAKKAVEENFDVVVAVGGDGSVNEVIRGLYGSRLVLGIIPKGSGNGLARSLQIPLHQKSAIQLLNDFHFQEINIGRAHKYLFASTAGIGFDALVTKEFQKYSLRGFWTYIWVILKNIWGYKTRVYQVKINNHSFKSDAFMLNIANSRELGYGFKIAPHSRMDDGLFDFVILQKHPLWITPIIAFRAFFGDLFKSKYVKIQKIKRIKISHPKLSHIQIDGESLICENEVTIEVLPEKLKVLRPKNTSI